MTVTITATWPSGDLLPAVRRTLDESERALLCVAFISQPGARLLKPQLERLGANARLLVTTVFSDQSVALDETASWGVCVRTLNLAGGTYHPKLYLGEGAGGQAVALIGSANLTSGLVANVEVAALLSGRRSDAELESAWRIGEELWRHPQSKPWQTAGRPPRLEPMSDKLWELVVATIRPGMTVYTLGQRPAPNLVSEVTREGIWVETQASREKGSGPQLVEAWMMQLAWDDLRAHGRLTNGRLLNELRVHRSSAVCALLAHLPGVEAASAGPIELRLLGEATLPG